MASDSNTPTGETSKQAATLIVANAQLSWLDTGLPYSLDFDDTYHSSEGAQAESRYLFLDGNRITQRWHEAYESAKRVVDCFTVAELGFGCGLNFLETLQRWTQAQSKPHRLHYVAFEKHPLTHADLTRALEQWPDLAAYSAQLLRQYPEHSAGCHRLYFGNDVTLDLHYGDALQRISAMSRSQETTIDAWYLDGFSPALNPSLWDLEIARAMALHSKEGTTATSYSVAGSARRALIEAGFSVTKRAGFGKKRHSLSAVFEKPASNSPALSGANTPVPSRANDVENRPNLSATAQPKNGTSQTGAARGGYDVLVIGAGLAGCSTAVALGRRGLTVKLIDSAPQPMSGASGIPQLALRPRLFRSAESGASFFLNAYSTARRFYAHLDALGQAAITAWHPSGVVQLSGALNKKQSLTPELVSALYDPRIVRPVNADAASALAGLEVTEGGWYFEGAGWLDPHTLAQNLLAFEKRIVPQFDSEIISISAEAADAATGKPRHWIATDARGNRYQAATVVLCNSHAIDSLAPDLGLRLNTARGQASLIKAETDSAALRCVVSGERSLFPAHNGTQLIAASYRTGSESLATRERIALDDDQNLAGIAAVFTKPLSRMQDGAAAAAVTQAPNEEQSLVAMRSAGEDFLPVVGRAPAVEAVVADLAALRRNAKAEIPTETAYQEGLFVNIGHGSNGVATCPLSAEYLASLICREPLPLDAAEAELISPARFIVRDIKKQTR